MNNTVVKVPQGGGTEREKIGAGTHYGRCYSALLLGTFEKEFEGKKKTQFIVMLGFELPRKMKVFKEGEPAKPMVIGREFTFSFYENAGFKKLIKSWTNQDFTDTSEFDFALVLGREGMLNIVDSKDGKYENLGGVSAMMEGLQSLPQINQTQFYNVLDHNQQQYDALPDWIKKKIETTPEFALIKNKVETDKKDANEFIQQHQSEVAKKVQEETPASQIDDDLPF